ncbi:MAG TPA: hypothetical protein PKA92_17605, partial [Flavobacteriales bacterium]|nr:hypothetical protein [Flavobacteriales bacterium]
MEVRYHYYDNANSPQMRPECIEDINGNDLSVTGFWFYDLFDHAQPVAFNRETDCDKGDLDEHQQGLQELHADYRSKLAVLHSAITSYNGTVDGGDRPDLLDAIADPVAWPSHALRTLLLDRGPLSDDVLAEAIRREVAMDPWHLTQVLIDNSPLKKDVEIVLDESEALSEFFLSLLAQYREGTSARDLLEQELAIRHTDKAVAQRRLIQAVAQDSTLEGRNDTLALIFGSDTMHWGDRYLYMLHLSNRDFTAAHALANSLLQVAPNEGLVTFGELLEDMLGDPNSISAPPVAALEALAFGEENSGAAHAWTRLLQLCATDSLPQGWVPEPYRSAFYPPEKYTGNMTPLLGAFPNPARDRVMISYPEGAELGTLEFFDAQGRLKRTMALQGRKAFVEVDLNGWSEGLYL